jgi:hypothetical protein
LLKVNVQNTVKVLKAYGYERRRVAGPIEKIKVEGIEKIKGRGWGPLEKIKRS